MGAKKKRYRRYRQQGEVESRKEMCQLSGALCLVSEAIQAALITEELNPKVQEEKSSNWRKLYGGKFEFNTK